MRSWFRRSHSTLQTRLFSFESEHSRKLKDVLSQDGACAALLGPMASGKSLLLEQLRNSLEAPCGVVSFEESIEFLREFGSQNVGKVCGGIGTAKARGLVVRFGLTSAWEKRVDSLSSGELKKLMLARKVVDQSEVLLLDGAHDGLDGPSRKELQSLLSALAKGMPRLLTDLGGKGGGGADQNMPPRKLVQVSHRPEEFAREIEHFFILNRNGEFEDEGEAVNISTEDPISVRQKKISQYFVSHEVIADDLERKLSLHFGNGRQTNNEPFIDLHHATASYSVPSKRFDVSFKGGISDLRLNISSGELHVILGRNGGGKSTLRNLISIPGLLQNEPPLSATLFHCNENFDSLKFEEINEEDQNFFGHRKGTKKAQTAIIDNIGAVSIDGHLRTLSIARKEKFSTRRVIASAFFGGACSGVASIKALFSKEKLDVGSDCEAVCEIVGLENAGQQVLERPFCELSLGEQRLALLARALVHRPMVLILDEASQGMDLSSRVLMKRILESLHRTRPEMALVLITHHADDVPEEVDHVLHLQSFGRAESWKTNTHKRAMEILGA